MAKSRTYTEEEMEAMVAEEKKKLAEAKKELRENSQCCDQSDNIGPLDITEIKPSFLLGKGQEDIISIENYGELKILVEKENSTKAVSIPANNSKETPPTKNKNEKPDVSKD